MVRRLLLAALLLAPLAAAQEAPAPATPAAPAKPDKPAKPPIYDEQADAHQQIAAALQRAHKENRRVLIQWGGNWCGWCHLLHELCASDKDIQHELQYEYDVVLVDIGRFDKHMDIAQSYGADLKGTGVPYLTVLDADGHPLANQETGALEAQGAEKPGHDPAKVLEFLRAHQAPYLQAADLKQAALAEAARDGRRVFLHFGAPWCIWCHRLEEWMARAPASELLPQDFVDCKIDIERTLGGAEMLQALRGGADGGIPWFAFLAADGTVLATSDGPEGNVGFPGQPAEIKHFRGMLDKAAVKMDTAARDRLEESLRPQTAKQPAAGSH